MEALQEWTQATVNSFCDFATSSLNMQSVAVGESFEELPDDSQGAYLPLMTPNAALHIGVVADKETMHDLACALLMMGPDEELSDEEVIDACSEITNVLGGIVKGQMINTEGDIKLGLPLYTSSKIDWQASAECQVVGVCDDPKLAVVVVYEAF